MHELLDLGVKAHGGLDQWKAVKSIAVEAIISGQLLEAKSFYEHLFTRIEIDTGTPRTTLTPYVGDGHRGVFPTRRRIVQRRPEGPKLTGITGVYLDFQRIDVRTQ